MNKERGLEGCGLDYSGLGHGQVTHSCEDGYKPAVSINSAKLIVQKTTTF